MKTKTSMLEYCKLVLQSVSFNKQLFKKEYRKSIKWLKQSELLQLKRWIRSEAKPVRLFLRSSKTTGVLLLMVLLSFSASGKTLCCGLDDSAKFNMKSSTYVSYVANQVPGRMLFNLATKNSGTDVVTLNQKLLSLNNLAKQERFSLNSFDRIQAQPVIQQEDWLVPVFQIRLRRR